MAVDYDDDSRPSFAGTAATTHKVAAQGGEGLGWMGGGRGGQVAGGGTTAIPSRQSYVRRPHDPCKLNETYERRKQQKVPMTLAMDDRFRFAWRIGDSGGGSWGRRGL